MFAISPSIKRTLGKKKSLRGQNLKRRSQRREVSAYLPCPQGHLLSSHPNRSHTRSIIIMMAPSSPIRKLRSEKRNILHGSGGAEIWIYVFKPQNLSSLPGIRHSHLDSLVKNEETKFFQGNMRVIFFCSWVTPIIEIICKQQPFPLNKSLVPPVSFI